MGKYFSLICPLDILISFSTLVTPVTRNMKDWWQGFLVNPAGFVQIERHPQTELLSLVNAPSRIRERRQTVAVDEKATLSDILDPSVQPVEIEPQQGARITARRHTADERPAHSMVSAADINPLPFLLENSSVPRAPRMQDVLEEPINSTLVEQQSNADDTPSADTCEPDLDTENIENDGEIATTNNAPVDVPNLFSQPLEFHAFVQGVRKSWNEKEHKQLFADRTNKR